MSKELGTKSYGIIRLSSSTGFVSAGFIIWRRLIVENAGPDDVAAVVGSTAAHVDGGSAPNLKKTKSVKI